MVTEHAPVPGMSVSQKGCIERGQGHESRINIGETHGETNSEGSKIMTKPWPKYIAKVLRYAQTLKSGAEIQHVNVLHDSWCSLLKGGECDCEPEIKAWSERRCTTSAA